MMTDTATPRTGSAQGVHETRTTLSLQPISYREAVAFIAQHHRHHEPPHGYKFGIAVNDGENVVGVVTVGRPIARMLDDGYTAEVTRCCTDSTPHVASKLYAAAWRACRAMGYRRLITYTLRDETGVSLCAAGWRVVYYTKDRPGGWDMPGRPRVVTYPTTAKTLWEVVA
jgi:hypothetical protein